MLCFWGFMEAALWLALAGQKSCGCLGQVAVNPWFMVAVDLGILAGLAFLRLDGSERTIRTHKLRFCGFFFAALALGVPGFMTMAVYRREPPKTYELRHDQLLHNTKVAVDLQQSTAQDLVALLATQMGTSVSVDDTVRKDFDACQPNWKSINHRTLRGWAVLEAVSKGMPVQSRWLTTKEGYVLIGDNPLQRAKSYWLAGLALGVLGFCWLAWNARQGRTRTDRSADVGDSPVGKSSGFA
jgi:hypothetical protein